MADFLRLHWKYLLGAVLLHVLFAGIFALTALTLPRDTPPPQLAIQAVIVDPSAVARAGRQQQEEREREQARQREAAAAEARREQEETLRRESEQRAQQERQVELQRREEEAQRRKLEEQQLRERQQAEQQQAERQREAAAQAERQKQAVAEREKQVEAERKRVAEIERKQKEEAERRKAADEARARAAREAELRSQIEAEEGLMEARASGAMNQYQAMIKQHIERRWIRPPSARPGIECEVKVAQTRAGTVLSVEIGRCNGDQAVQQSIITAVQRADPLPQPPDPRLFERNLNLTFKPDQ